MCVNVIRRQPSLVSVQRRFRPCRRHLCRRPSSVPAPSASGTCSATSSIFQITAIALSTLLNRFAASVRSLRAAKGDSTTFVVLTCFHSRTDPSHAPDSQRPRRLTTPAGKQRPQRSTPHDSRLPRNISLACSWPLRKLVQLWFQHLCSLASDTRCARSPDAQYHQFRTIPRSLRSLSASDQLCVDSL